MVNNWNQQQGENIISRDESFFLTLYSRVFQSASPPTRDSNDKQTKF
jgi:hypothetical protein